MAKKDNKTNAVKKQSAVLSSLNRHITHPKLIIFLLILLAIPGYAAFSNKYKDWDNAQMIKGLAKDFPELIAEAEEVSGIGLDIRADCMTTQEKFTSGVRTCELLVVAEEPDSARKDQFLAVVRSSSKFNAEEEYENGKGYHTYYRDKRACGVGIDARGEGTVSVSCLIGIRDANLELAKEVFSRDL